MPMTLDLAHVPYEDLPDTDGQPMDSDLHREQATTYLIEPLKEHFRQVGFKAYVSGNSFVYYDRRPGGQPVGPDFYVVNGGRQGRQKMWVSWREGNKLPSLVIEMLSPTSEANDRGKKFCLYRDDLKVKDYFLLRLEEEGEPTLEGFRLTRGMYLPVLPDRDGRFSCASLKLKLGFHEGWLRWFDAEGSRLLTGSERAEQERTRAEQERTRAEQAEAELIRLREELRRLRPAD